MSKINWRNFFELVGLVAIVLSLIFVGLQMRQDQILARSELGAGTVEVMIEVRSTVSDPDFAKTWAKSLNEPENLSDDEMVQINSYLANTKAIFIRECYLVSRGVFAECDNVLNSQIPKIFGSEYAKSWWRLNWRSDGILPDWVNTVVEDLEPDTIRGDLKSIRDEI